MIGAAENRFGRFEIGECIGTGGMSEVYRAYDPTLGRTVAIKILSPVSSSSAAACRRFEDEARAVAALSHPNIVAVFDVGFCDAVPYIISELLEGATLRSRLGAGLLPLRKIFDYATQIASGLAAAHDKGIIHRDLKPENIYVTNDGHVKILDFGIAKLQPLPTARDGSDVATSTMPGMILGTVGYMSPEQVAGGEVDARSDIFSFGAVLFEMVTGRRAFHGDTVPDTLSAILHADPGEMTRDDGPVPLSLEKVTRHCLEKKPADRFRSARDVGFYLQTLADSPSASIPLLVPARVAIPARNRSVVLRSLLALFIVAIIGGAAYRLWPKRQSSPSVPHYRQLTFRRGNITGARFSPDGATVVYSAAFDGEPSELYSERIDTLGSVSLGLKNASIVAVSSSGEALAVADSRHLRWATRVGTLVRVAITGGAPKPILQDVQDADWGGDGAIAASRYVNDNFRLEYPIGKVLYETHGWITDVHVSPSGDTVAFADHDSIGDTAGSIAIIDSGGHKKTISQHWEDLTGIAWSADGKTIWCTAGDGVAVQVYAVALTGEQRPLTSLPGQASIFDVSRDGRMLISTGSDRRFLLASHQGSTAHADLSFGAAPVVMGLTPDGEYVLFLDEGHVKAGVTSVILRRTDGSPPLTVTEGVAFAVSNDHQWVLVASASVPRQLSIVPTGTGETRQVTHDAIDHVAASFLPDGKRFVFIGAEPGHGARLYVQDLNRGSPTAISEEGMLPPFVIVSPDGRKLLARNVNSGPMLYSLDGTPAIPVKGVLRGEVARTFSTSGDLYVQEDNQHPASVYRLNPYTGKRTLFTRIMVADPAGVWSVAPVLVVPDGRSWIYGFGRRLNDLYLATEVE